ncbi:MAG: redoxin domain-containing protein [Ferruginibacter sp.]
MNKWLAISCVIVIFSFVGLLFWYNEWRYNLPTPVPESYHPVGLRAYIDLAGKYIPQVNKPVLLHFFNPDCPCSKFNIAHFKSLVTEYADEINFAVVVITEDKNYTKENISRKFGITVPVLIDSSLARICGVYSTPQAVLLNDDHSLFYRGNYNRSRYCTDKKTNYAQNAIDSLIAGRRQPAYNHFALTAYGCSLPICKK